MDQFCFGVDLGGTTVKIGLFTVDGMLQEKWEIPTRTENQGAAILSDIAASIQNKVDVRHLTKEQVTGIGIGVPGPVLNENRVQGCVNLGGGNVCVADELSALTGMTVKAANDANVAALGEQWQGGGKGYRNIVMFTLGTGVGGGIIQNGQIVSGANGAAGEIGHMRLEKNGRRCYCGNYGCFDAYCNTLILKDAAGGELKDFFAGIDQGNREYERILDEYVERLSDAVFNIRMLYDDTVLIGGELGEYADYFIEKVWGILDSQDIYREESAKDYVKVCEDGENVIAIGAAMYYINQAAVRL